MEFTEKQLKYIWREEGFEQPNGDWVEVEVIEDGNDWEDDGKYQYALVVFIYNGKTYAFDISRSGSYFTEYHYEIMGGAYEVELATKTIEYWRAK
jgi:hypothetical protein